MINRKWGKEKYIGSEKNLFPTHQKKNKDEERTDWVLSHLYSFIHLINYEQISTGHLFGLKGKDVQEISLILKQNHVTTVFIANKAINNSNLKEL